MSLPGHDDTSAGRITQGGHRDETAPGPHRRSGNSFWWFAVVFLVVAVAAVAWLTVGSRKSAPAEANTAPVAAASSTAADPASGAPPSAPAR